MRSWDLVPDNVPPSNLWAPCSFQWLQLKDPHPVLVELGMSPGVEDLGLLRGLLSCTGRFVEQTTLTVERK